MAKPSVATATVVKSRKPAAPVTVATATNVKPAKVKAAPAPVQAEAAPKKERAPIANRSTGERIDVSRKLKLLVKENPKREGTKAHAMWEKYQNGMTVADARQAGVTMADIQWNIAHNYLALA